MKIIDLHTHSNQSDGTLQPRELVACAKEAGLAAIALTDHDTAAGIPEAVLAGKELGVEVVPGIEIDADYSGFEIHILGYFIDYEGQYFNEAVKLLSDKRLRRNERLMERLRSLNMPVTREDLRAEKGCGMVTRLHYARVLVKKGYVSSVSEAFDRYLNEGRPAFVERHSLDYRQCIELIGSSGGVSSLAHPYLYRLNGGEVIKMLGSLREAGLDAVEAIHPTHDARQTAELYKAAEGLGLKITGGSDFHGANKPRVKIGVGMDNIRVGYDILECLRKLRNEEKQT